MSKSKRKKIEQEKLFTKRIIYGNGKFIMIHAKIEYMPPSFPFTPIFFQIEQMVLEFLDGRTNSNELIRDDVCV